MRPIYPGPDTRADLRRKAPDAQALAVWRAWGRGVSPHTLAARASALSSFGRFSWRAPTEITVIRRVLDVIGDDPTAIRPLALAWIEHEAACGASPATLAQRWRMLSALVGAIAKHTAIATAPLGARPKPPRRSVAGDGVAELMRELMRAGRPRDAAIVGLLGEVGMRDVAVLALRVRDVDRVIASADLRAALARATAGARPQDFAIRARRGRSLSIAALYQIVEHEGTTVAALRRAAG